MILTGRDIQWYIEAGKLEIRGATPEQFQQNGVDLILHAIESGPNNYLFKGNFYLGVTREILRLPDDLMAFVELRSTWARRGLMIPPTIVDAGFRGDLTLEVVSFRTQPAPIGERFAHVIFSKLSGPAIPYDGKYQNQNGIQRALPDLKAAA